MILKDGGDGITDKSLKFWNENKSKLGKISHVEVSAEGWIDRDGYEYPVEYEYNCMIVGKDATMLLSGCNCGYFGQGPHGTAKILTELGLNKSEAERVIGQQTIHYDALRNTLVDSQRY